MALLFLLTLGFHAFTGVWSGPPRDDEGGYLRFAEHFWQYILEGNRHDPKDALPFWWPPAAPFFLWCLRSAGLESVEALRVAMHVVAALIPALTWLWARTLLPCGWAFLAALLCALDPYVARESGMIQSDLMFVLACLWLFRLPLAGRGGWGCLRLGLVLGLMGLLRTAVVFFVPFVMWELWRGYAPTSRIKRVLVLMMGVFLGLSPLLIRNYSLTDRVFLTKVSGFVLVANNAPFHLEEGWTVPGQGLRRAVTLHPNTCGLVDRKHAATLPALERDDYYATQARNFMAKNPSMWWINAYHRVLAIFHLYPPSGPGEDGLMRTLVLLGFTGLIALALGGAWLTRHDPAYAWCRVALGGVTLLAFCTMVQMRYRFPLHPPLFILAMVGCASIFKTQKKNGDRFP